MWFSVLFEIQYIQYAWYKNECTQVNAASVTLPCDHHTVDFKRQEVKELYELTLIL